MPTGELPIGSTGLSARLAKESFRHGGSTFLNFLPFEIIPAQEVPVRVTARILGSVPRRVVPAAVFPDMHRNAEQPADLCIGEDLLLAPVANDPVPDVRRAVAQMISRGKGGAITLLGQRTLSRLRGKYPETDSIQRYRSG